jgi:hypothetical protein
MEYDNNHFIIASRAYSLQKAPLVEFSARRSPRLKSKNKGFKPKICFDRNCLACAEPPRLKKSVIQNLYNKFGMPESSGEQITEEVVPTTLADDPLSSSDDDA